MTFLERLRAYLERVARSPDGLPFLHIGASSHRKGLIEAARDILKGAQPDSYSIFRQLLKSERIVQAFESLLSRRILETFAPEASSEELSSLVHDAMTALIHSADEEPWPLTERLIGFAPLARWAWEHVGEHDALDGWPIPPYYAFEIRLVRRRGSRVAISRAGEVLLELPGTEAVRWLLTLESVQSLGPDDDWRTSPEVAAALLESPRQNEYERDEGVSPWSHSMASLRRLGALQVVKYYGSDREHGYVWGYDVPGRARPLLEEIAGERSTPFAVLARALLHDDLDRAMSRMHIEYARAVQESVAATTALQARMVVHEVRNALLPSQMALESLSSHLGEAALTEPAQRFRRRIEGGLGRALKFVDEMLQVANLGDEPPTVFDACEAVREAAAGVTDMLNGNLHVTAPDEPRLVFGPRSRFVPAVVNLLRNASQAVAEREAGAPKGRVELTFGADEANVVIYVDDNGSGVPPEQRRAIFEAGVALRSGGSGQGLALVRHVVETEMAGAVRCEAGPLGGARFTIVVPARRTEGT